MFCILHCASVSFPSVHLFCLVPQYRVESIVKLNNHAKFKEDFTFALPLSDIGSSKKRMQLKAGRADQITNDLETNQ